MFKFFDFILLTLCVIGVWFNFNFIAWDSFWWGIVSGLILGECINLILNKVKK